MYVAKSKFMGSRMMLATWLTGMLTGPMESDANAAASSSTPSTADAVASRAMMLMLLERQLI
jgi:hypothetical protein